MSQSQYEPHEVERRVARAGVVIGLALAGVVGAALVSNAHHPVASGDDRDIAAAVTTADPGPTPSASFRAAPPAHPALIRCASGDPLLAKGFGQMRVAPALTYANLTVFPVYQSGKSFAAGRGPRLTTLDAAMGNGAVSVVEPSLTVTNVGPQPTYVPGGEVVPGGDQDQGVATDSVIPPQSRDVSVASFCVEARRSSGPSPEFDRDVAIAIPAVRYAMQVTGDQQRVWDSVAAATDHFDARTDTGTYHALVQSASAQAAALPYVSALALPVQRAAHGRPVGAVVTLNGKIVCADLYRDPALFAQIWPSLLRSYALQAAMCPPDLRRGKAETTIDLAGKWLAALDTAPGAQNGSSVGTRVARVATPSGAGVRTAALGDGARPTTLLHEAFWTADASLTNGS